MKLLDANILLYAVNRDSPYHSEAKAWLESALSADETVVLPWIVILAFIRIGTHPGTLEQPLSSGEAIRIVDSWLERPMVTTLGAGDGHWRVLRQQIEAGGVTGNLTTDAHLAAIAIELGADLYSTDRDFGRFKRLHWIHPFD